MRSLRHSHFTFRTSWALPELQLSSWFLTLFNWECTTNDPIMRHPSKYKRGTAWIVEMIYTLEKVTKTLTNLSDDKLHAYGITQVVECCYMSFHMQLAPNVTFPNSLDVWINCNLFKCVCVSRTAYEAVMWINTSSYIGILTAYLDCYKVQKHSPGTWHILLIMSLYYMWTCVLQLV